MLQMFAAKNNCKSICSAVTGHDEKWVSFLKAGFQRRGRKGFRREAK
jgi:hypothetical protein